MVLPPEKRLRFFVYVIESPSAVDLYHRRTEGEVIRQAVHLNRISCVSKLAINVESFIASIRVGLHEEMEERPGLVPVLHISAHGYDDGIQLSSGEILLWNDLRDLLRPVNKALNGALLVCMSTCEGYAGIRMAMEEGEDDHPYYAIVGNSGKPTWPETAVAFASFYHLVANGHFVAEAVEAMRIASGNGQFFLNTAQQAKQTFLDYIKNVDTASATEELKEEEEKHEPAGELTKLLRDDRER